MSTNNLMNKIEAAHVDITDVAKHFEVQEPVKQIVKQWAYECQIMDFDTTNDKIFIDDDPEQEDYNYLVNLITKWILTDYQVAS